MTQRVVVVQVFVAKRQAEHTLADKGAHLMLNHLLATRRIVCDMNCAIVDTMTVSAFGSVDVQPKRGLA